MSGEHVGEEGREWDAAAAVVLGCAVDQHADATSVTAWSTFTWRRSMVEIPDAERCHLTPAEPGVGKEEDDVSVLSSEVGEVLHMCMREVGVLALHDVRQLHAVSPVTAEASVSYGVLQHHAHHTVMAAGRRGCRGGRDFAQPVLDAHVSRFARETLDQCDKVAARTIVA